MTTPHINNASQMPEGVLKVDQLGDNLQGLNPDKIKATTESRMASNFLGTPGGLAGGPIRFINGLFANFLGGIADDAVDSPTVSSPDDVRGLTNPLFGELVRESGHIPIIGDIIEGITGVEDGDLNDLGTFFIQLKTLLSGGTVGSPLPNLVGIALGTVQSMVNQISDIFNGLIVTPINTAIQGVKDWFSDLLGWKSTTTAKSDALVNAYMGTTGTDKTPAQLAAVGTSIQNRITAIEGSGARFLCTSSTTLDLSAYRSFKVMLIGSSQPGQPGSNSRTKSMVRGGSGGVDGGFTFVTFTAAELTALGVNLAACQVSVGTSSATTRFGNYGSSWAAVTTPGARTTWTSDGLAIEVQNGPGYGGTGGSDDVAANPSGSGSAGVSSLLATAGTGGAGTATGGGTGGAGTAGGSVDVTGILRTGGAGGGGGGAGNNNALGFASDGGPGGNGGYPGGGPGGGGSGGYGTYATGAGGSPGAVANGVAIIEAYTA